MQEQKKTGAFDVVHAVIFGWAATIYLPIRWRVGKDHPGIAGIAGIVWLFLYTAYNNDDRVILLLPVFVLSIIIHRFAGAYRNARGDYEHSLYDGWPWLALWGVKNKNERFAKMVTEPVFSVVIGLLLYDVSRAASNYFMFGAIAMVIGQLLIDQHRQRRVTDVRNAMLENRFSMDQLNGRRVFNG